MHNGRDNEQRRAMADYLSELYPKTPHLYEADAIRFQMIEHPVTTGLGGANEVSHDDNWVSDCK